MDLDSRFSAALAAISPELVAENGYCALTVDARLVLHVALDDASGDIVLWANFPAAAGRDGLPRQLLHANYFWQGAGGATWSLDPATDTPMLAERLASSHWDSAAFDSLLQGFADRALAWESELGASAPQSATTAPVSPESFTHAGFGNPFLRA